MNIIHCSDLQRCIVINVISALIKRSITSLNIRMQHKMETKMRQVGKGNVKLANVNSYGKTGTKISVASSSE